MTNFMSIFKRRNINSWNLVDNSKKSEKIRKIVLNNNEIYILETVFNCVRVFSYQ